MLKSIINLNNYRKSVFGSTSSKCRYEKSYEEYEAERGNLRNIQKKLKKNILLTEEEFNLAIKRSITPNCGIAGRNGLVFAYNSLTMYTTLNEASGTAVKDYYNLPNACEFEEVYELGPDAPGSIKARKKYVLISDKLTITANLLEYVKGTKAGDTKLVINVYED